MLLKGAVAACPNCTRDWSIIAHRPGEFTDEQLGELKTFLRSTDGVQSELLKDQASPVMRKLLEKRRAFHRVLVCSGPPKHDSLYFVALKVAVSVGRRLGIPNAAVPLDPEDFVAETLLRTLFEAVVLRELRGSPYALYKGVVYNKIVDALRRSPGVDALRPLLETDAAPTPADPPGQDEVHLDDDRRRVAEAAAEKLSGKVGSVARRTLANASVRTIARELGLPPNTVRVYVNRAAQRIRARLRRA